MSLPDPNLPPDPWGDAPDLSVWAGNCRAMYMALLATGFKELEALEITIRCMQAMLAKIT